MRGHRLGAAGVRGRGLCPVAWRAFPPAACTRWRNEGWTPGPAPHCCPWRSRGAARLRPAVSRRLATSPAWRPCLTWRHGSGRCASGPAAGSLPCAHAALFPPHSSTRLGAPRVQELDALAVLALQARDRSLSLPLGLLQCRPAWPSPAPGARAPPAGNGRHDADGGGAARARPLGAASEGLSVCAPAAWPHWRRTQRLSHALASLLCEVRLPFAASLVQLLLFPLFPLPRLRSAHRTQRHWPAWAWRCCGCCCAAGAGGAAPGAPRGAVHHGEAPPGVPPAAAPEGGAERQGPAAGRRTGRGGTAAALLLSVPQGDGASTCW